MKKANKREVVTTKRCKNNPTRVFTVEIDKDVLILAKQILAVRQEKLPFGQRAHLKYLYADAMRLGMRTIMGNIPVLTKRKDRKNIKYIGFSIDTELYGKYQQAHDQLIYRSGIHFQQGIILEHGIKQLYANEVGKRWWQFWK